MIYELKLSELMTELNYDQRKQANI